MEKAKSAVSSFLSHDGKHKTTVDEEVRGAVTEEHVKPHHHEHVQTAVDKEVHQHHHHTTVQPITHRETLPEQHHHNMAPVEHKEFHHGNERDVKSTLEQDASRYRDTSVTHDTTRSQEAAPVVTGERVHHHVHEHVQPVVQKEVHQPHVVHTTIPVHETHHLEAVHHGTSVLPTKTLNEFTGGAKNALEGRSSTQLHEYDGCPKPYKKELQHETLEGDKHMHLHDHEHSGTGHHHTGAAVGGAGVSGVGGTTGTHHNTGLGNTSGTTGTHRNTDYDNTSGTTGTHHNTGLGNNSGTTGLGNTSGTTGLGNTSGTTGTRDSGLNTTGTNTSGTSQTKPSLLDRLNPMKDTDNDGKRGVMD